MSSAFDPTQFLDAVTEEAATRRPPLPATQTYIGIIGKPKVRQSEGKKESNRGEIYTFVDFPIEVDLNQYPDVKAQLGGALEKVTLNHGVSLHVTAVGAIDWAPGRNGGMRQMREAVGMNVPGESFAISRMEGRPIMLKIKHEEYPPGSGDLQDRVDSVMKAG